MDTKTPPQTKCPQCGSMFCGPVACRFTGLKNVLALAWLLLMQACTTIGIHSQVEGWPALKVTEHYVPNRVMRDQCGKYVAFGSSPMACAEFNLNAGTCEIWFSADFPPTDSMIEHERLHCQGYDHIGGQTMQHALDAWKSMQASR